MITDPDKIIATRELGYFVDGHQLVFARVRPERRSIDGTLLEPENVVARSAQPVTHREVELFNLWLRYREFPQALEDRNLHRSVLASLCRAALVAGNRDELVIAVTAARHAVQLLPSE